MREKYKRGLSVWALGVVTVCLSSCATCKTQYRKELSDNPKLAEANTSYEKAIHWLDKAECSSTRTESESFYRTAESYVSDAIYKLEQQGRDHHMDVSEYIAYCEKIKRETDVKIGAADRADQSL